MNIVITRFPYESQLGGMETLVLNLAKGLREKGHTVSFIGNCSVLRTLFEENDFKSTNMVLPKAPVTKGSLLLFILFYPFIWWQMRKLVQGLHEGDTLYMLSLTEKIACTRLAYKKGIKIVWGEHEAIQNPDGSFKPWLYRNPFLRRYRKNSQYARVVMVSRDLEKQFQLLGKVHHITVIENGIDTQFFHPSSTQKYTDLQQQFVIGTVTRLVQGKGIFEFLDVAQRIHRKIKDAFFVIAGDGHLRKEAEHYILSKEMQPYCLLLGEIPYHRIREVYNLFDVALFLSQEKESFGLTPLESMAMKKPTILTSAFGFLDEEAKTKLLIIEPYQMDKAVEWVEKLYHDTGLRKHVIEEAYHFVSRRFSFTGMVDLYEKVFSDPSAKVT